MNSKPAGEFVRESLASPYLSYYDGQLRTDAETPSAVKVQRLGPLRLINFTGGQGFITYAHIAPTDDTNLASLVGESLAYFREQPEIHDVEWKSRGHDHAPGLHEQLLAHGFAVDASESIMVGRAADLSAETPLPAGVRLRQIFSEADVRAMTAMQDLTFGEAVSAHHAEAILRRLATADGMQLWVAENSTGEILSAGRLEPVPGTDFAGIWGGATVAAYRGQGIYRALTAARARAALDLGKTLIHSDSTEYSRPILERYGLLKVSTTTPYRWSRTQL
ncbi:GNAT family N-acetyltransferase [Arthrobacter sp. MYb213]|uniref:GNAT family N-acetyltransferase n=1 Tax=Arthrobacter sp. MYb213 TaxID=1848595 RepID=UPI00257021C1|nr:GNAT family N-acetyltransferase [Arthrobacter sp. MYb213]